MAELKTRRTDGSVQRFLDGISSKQRRDDCSAVLEIMKRATKAEPRMWGSSIVGLGDHRYKYDSGRELDWFVIGFSPRKDSLTLYAVGGFPRYEALLKKLGSHKLGKGCLYIKRLADVNEKVLNSLVRAVVAQASGGKG